MTIDTTVNVFMQSIQFPPFVFLSKLIAIIFEPMVLVIISFIVAAYVYIKKSKKKAIFLGLAMATTGVAIKILKEVFQRARPLNSIVQESGFSFPSGHATAAVVFVGTLFYFFTSRRKELPATLMAASLILLIGITRLYLRVHWLTDVLGGFVLGGLILMLAIFAYNKL